MLYLLGVLACFLSQIMTKFVTK